MSAIAMRPFYFRSHPNWKADRRKPSSSRRSITSLGSTGGRRSGHRLEAQRLAGAKRGSGPECRRPSGIQGARDRQFRHSYPRRSFRILARPLETGNPAKIQGGSPCTANSRRLSRMADEMGRGLRDRGSIRRLSSNKLSNSWPATATSKKAWASRP
jgi:hypothetical protein